jgi:hypothetical protein
VVARDRADQDYSDDATQQTDTDSHGVTPFRGRGPGFLARFVKNGDSSTIWCLGA